jgi:lipopolysaccharide biosynthesis regulator YciM
MTNNSQPTASALLREAAESHAQAARASVALQSVAASAAAAQAAIDAGSNALIRAEVSLNRAADALDESEE